MSSPPAIDYPSDDADVDMGDGTNGEQSMPNAPPVQPLFFPGTPTTPASRRGQSMNAMPSSPIGSAVARRALGMTTPKRTPLFEGGE